MEKAALSLLFDLLDRLLNEEAPCKGGQCKGHLNCEFGENGFGGETCAIEDVQGVVARIMCSK